MNPPTSFGKYGVIRLLGQGGFGEVYLAHDPNLVDKVAIKTIYPHLARERGFERRFLREARLLRKLNHSNIVRLYAFEVVNGQPFMVMEYLAGGTLKDRLAKLRARGQKMSLEEIAQLMDKIGDALDHAHKLGAIHRDIKPANILFRSPGEPVLTDFGIAKLMEESVRLSKPGETSGTASYMSPEQAGGIPVDVRSDVYSLGIVLYELVTGRVPFLGETPAAVLKKHVYDPPPPPKQFNPDVADAIQTVILKALEKNPDARFASTGELAKAFSAAVRGEIPVEKEERKGSDQETVREPLPEDKSLEKESSSRRPQFNLPTMAGYSVSGCLLLIFCFLMIVGASLFLPKFFPTTPTASARVSPSVTATSLPTPSLPSACPPQTGGRLVLFDEFNDSKSGWGSTSELYYENGAFMMRMTVTESVRYKSMEVANLSSRYRIETHAQRVSGPADSGYGLLFGHQDEDNYYLFRINDLGKYRVSKQVRGQWETLQDWTVTPLVQSGKSNALGVLIGVTSITPCINGTKLTPINDYGLKPGKIGLTISTTNVAAHFRFEDFAVWKLE
jgi:serine/threonine protein kinase